MLLDLPVKLRPSLIQQLGFVVFFFLPPASLFPCNLSVFRSLLVGSFVSLSHSVPSSFCVCEQTA